MPELVMPRLSDSMEEGTILKWLKAVGEEVAVGEELVEIETDKANMVYESDTAGTLTEILAQEGDTLPIGEVIARVGDPAAAQGNGAAASTPPKEPTPTAAPPRTPGREAEEVRVGETAKGRTEVVELTKLQQTVSRRMAESKATAPHFYLQAEIDMSAAVAARGRLKKMAKEGEPVPTYNDMIVKACALALREMPRANGAYRDGHLELYSRVNVGVAVAASDALVVPTVFDADLKGLRQISVDTRALASRVRDGSITPPELSGGTFTVSNLGMYGISNFHAVINSPQAAILAVGELTAKPVVTGGGTIEARELMGVTLACDHRILYGADGAIFLGRVRELLTEPIGLAL
jgi:pyruvate dehydrogenase E2 component (dihydrolipoamide acetyltransferase)